MRVGVWVLAASATVIASCGGGGGGGSVGNAGGSGSTTNLYVTLTYPNTAVSLFQPVAVQPQLGGFEGHAANCTLIGGSLPAGLSLGGDCVIGGRPLQDGMFNFTVRVGASGASNTLDVNAQLKVAGPLVQYPLRTFLQALSIGDAVSDVPSFANWTAASDLQATWSYRVVGGALPPGLALDTTTGRITGTAAGSGAFNAQVQSTLATRFGTYTPVVSSYAVNVNVPLVGYTGGDDGALDATERVVYISEPVTLQPVLLGAFLPGATIGNVTIQGGVPAGLALNAADGLISGTPTGPATDAVQHDVQATVNNGGASAATQGLLMLRVSSPVYYTYAGGGTYAVNQPLALAPKRTTAATVTLSPTQTVSFQSRVGDCSLPAGVTLDGTTGTVSGTPTATGSFSCSVDETITNNGVTWTQGTYLQFLVQ